MAKYGIVAPAGCQGLLRLIEMIVEERRARAASGGHNLPIEAT
jgi:hypothetical protein